LEEEPGIILVESDPGIILPFEVEDVEVINDFTTILKVKFEERDDLL
jgi:hypothetical protein